MKTTVLRRLNESVLESSGLLADILCLDHKIDKDSISVKTLIKDYLGDSSSVIFEAFKKNVDGLAKLVENVESSIVTYDDLIEYLLLLDHAMLKIEDDSDYFHHMTLVNEYAQVHGFKVSIIEFRAEIHRLLVELETGEDDENFTKSKAKLYMAEKLNELIQETQKMIAFKFALLKLKKTLKNNRFLAISFN